MPKIIEIILILEGYQYAKSLDLNMWYYHLQLSEGASNLYKNYSSIGKYHYKHLSLQVSNSPETFQQKMKDLFQEFEFIRAYIDNISILKKDSNRPCT